AAVQISTPLTDAAWEVLRPRLLAQCSAAEQIENEIIQQINNFKTQQEDRRQEDTTTKDVKALTDRDWEESQKSIHERLSTYADEIISNDWANGRRISKENCPAFAAEVLLYVRRRFYASIAHVDANADSFGREPDSARDRYEDIYVTNCYGNDPDDRLGVEFLPDYEARLPSPPKSARHVEQLLHENTKHDRIPHDTLDLRDRSPSVPRGEAAAEQFLNEVLPGDRFEDYIRKAAEQDRRKEDELRAKWLVEQDIVNGPRDAPEAQSDHPPYAERAPGPTGGYHAMQTPAVPLHHDLIHRRVSDLVYAPHQGDSTHRDNGFYRSNGDHSAHPAARRLPQRTDFPEPASRMARTRSSRYQRYDEQWRQLSRARSKSPRRLEAHEEPPIYRDRSPESSERSQRVIHTTSQQAPRDFASLDVDDYYSPEPLQPRYVDAPPIYVDEYGRQVEYVRIVSAPREMYPQRRYVVSQSDEPEGVVEYVRYAPRPHDEQFYDDQRAAYYEEDRPAYQTEAAPRIYEDDPMREVRYTEQP
ncbi:hypothetical protein B0A49_07442, partial [Cryomyces minteri]